MAKPKRRDLPPVEPMAAIPEVLGGAVTRSPRWQQKRDRSWGVARSKATYDLPADLIERIREIAADLGTTVKASDVARLLLEVRL